MSRGGCVQGRVRPGEGVFRGGCVQGRCVQGRVCPGEGVFKGGCVQGRVYPLGLNSWEDTVHNLLCWYTHSMQCVDSLLKVNVSSDTSSDVETCRVPSLKLICQQVCKYTVGEFECGV